MLLAPGFEFRSAAFVGGGPTCIAALALEPGARAVAGGRIGGEADRVGKVVERAVQIALALAGEAAIEPGRRVVRIAGERLVERRDHVVDIFVGQPRQPFGAAGPGRGTHPRCRHGDVCRGVGLGFQRLIGVIKFIRRNSRWVTRTGGALLVLVGIALVTGVWSDLMIALTTNVGPGSVPI